MGSPPRSARARGQRRSRRRDRGRPSPRGRYATSPPPTVGASEPARGSATRAGIVRPTKEPSAAIARQPLFHRLNAFDHLGVAGAVLVPHRFDGILERLLVGDVENLIAGRPGLVERQLLVFHPQLALLELRLATELFDQ